MAIGSEVTFMRSSNELMEAVDAGDHISNEELDSLIENLVTLETRLRIVNHEPYELVLRDVRRRLDNLKNYKQAREKNK